MAFQAHDRDKLGLLSGAVLIAGLFACSHQPAEKADAETESGGASAGASGYVAPTPPRPPDTVRVTVAQGTQIPVTLSTEIGSETSHAGDSLTVTTTSAVVSGDEVAIPAGSTIFGRVTDVTPASKGLKVSEKGGSVAISFSKVTTPRGDSAPMDASLVEVASSSGKTAGIIGGSAAGGAILGKILGGDSKDAAIGAVVGGGIGTGIAAGTKGKKLVIPAGTQLVLTLDRPLTMEVPS